jgi:hypothetical protein
MRLATPPAGCRAGTAAVAATRLSRGNREQMERARSVLRPPEHRQPNSFNGAEGEGARASRRLQPRKHCQSAANALPMQILYLSPCQKDGRGSQLQLAFRFGQSGSICRAMATTERPADPAGAGISRHWSRSSMGSTRWTGRLLPRLPGAGLIRFRRTGSRSRRGVHLVLVFVGAPIWRIHYGPTTSSRRDRPDVAVDGPWTHVYGRRMRARRVSSAARSFSAVTGRPVATTPSAPLWRARLAGGRRGHDAARCRSVSRWPARRLFRGGGFVSRSRDRDMFPILLFAIALQHTRQSLNNVTFGYSATAWSRPCS